MTIIIQLISLLFILFYSNSFEIKADDCVVSTITEEADDDLEALLKAEEMANLSGRAMPKDKLFKDVKFFKKNDLDLAVKKGGGKLEISIDGKNYEVEVIVKKPSTEVINYADDNGVAHSYTYTSPSIVTIKWPDSLMSIDQRVELMELYYNNVLGAKKLKLEPMTTSSGGALEGGMRRLYRDVNTGTIYKCAKEFVPKTFLELAVRQTINTNYVNNVVSKEIYAKTGFRVSVKPHLTTSSGLFGCESQKASAGGMSLMQRRKNIFDQKTNHLSIDEYNNRLKQLDSIFNKHKKYLTSFGKSGDIAKGISDEVHSKLIIYELVKWHFSNVVSSKMFTEQGPARLYPFMSYFNRIPATKASSRDLKLLNQHVKEIRAQINNPKSNLYNLRWLFPHNREINADDVLAVKKIFTSFNNIIASGKTQQVIADQMNNAIELFKLKSQTRYLSAAHDVAVKKLSAIELEFPFLDRVPSGPEKDKALVKLNNQFLNYRREVEKLKSQLKEANSLIGELDSKTTKEVKDLLEQTYKVANPNDIHPDFYPYYYGQMATEHGFSGALDTGRINFNTSIGLPADLDNAFVKPNSNGEDLFEFVDI